MQNITNEEKYKRIFITNLEKPYLTTPARLILNNIGIFTLKDLFSVNEKELKQRLDNLKTIFNSSTINEIIGTARLLRCQYLDEDPKISLDDPSKLDLKIDFGFSARTAGSLLRWPEYVPYKVDPLEAVINQDYKKISRARGIGLETVEEIKLKMTILSNYYKKRSSQEIINFENSTPQKSTSELLSELKQMRQEVKKTTDEKQISDSMIKLEEKTDERPKKI